MNKDERDRTASHDILTESVSWTANTADLLLSSRPWHDGTRQTWQGKAKVILGRSRLPHPVAAVVAEDTTLYDAKFVFESWSTAASDQALFANACPTKRAAITLVCVG